MDEFVREVARCTDVDVVDNDHGGLGLGATFRYEGSAAQGFGYVINAEFIRRFMLVFRVERLRDAIGKACWVTHSSGKIVKVEPLLTGEGQPFDIEAWSAELRKRSER